MLGVVLLALVGQEARVGALRDTLQQVFPDDRIAGEQRLLDCIVFADTSLPPDDIAKNLKRLLSVEFSRKNGVVTVYQTKEDKKQQIETSRRNNGLAYKQLLVLTKQSLPSGKTPQERAQDFIEKIRNEAENEKNGIYAGITDPDSFEPLRRARIPMQEFATEFFVKEGKERLLPMPSGSAAVVSTQPTRLQQAFGKDVFNSIQLYKDTESQLLALLPERVDNDGYRIAFLEEYRKTLESDQETSIVAIHCVKTGPRNYAMYPVAYDAKGNIKRFSVVGFDARNLILKEWVETSPDEMPDSLLVEVTENMQVWADVLSADPARVAFSTLKLVPEMEPQDVFFTDALKEFGKVTQKRVWAWLPDSALDHIARSMSKSGFDAAKHVRWLVSTGRVEIEVGETDIFITPSDPEITLSSQISRPNLLLATKQVKSETGLDFETYLRIFGNTLSFRVSELREQIGSLLWAQDKALSGGGYAARYDVRPLLLTDGLLNTLKQLKTVSIRLSEATPQVRSWVLNRLAMHPKPPNALILDSSPEIFLSGTYAASDVPPNEQELLFSLNDVDQYILEPIKFRGGSDDVWLPPFTIGQLGDSLGQWWYADVINKSMLEKFQVRITKRPVIEVKLRIGTRVEYIDRILGRVSDERSEPVFIKDLPKSVRDEFDKAFAERDRMKRLENRGGRASL